jgi:sugar phosphate permease
MVDVKSDEKNIQVVSINPQLAGDEVDVSVLDFKDDPGDKKLLRKLDLYLLPVITLLYMLSYLDRVNIGQAKLDGLAQSLHLTSNQYNNCLCVFFVTFVVFEIPSNLILKRVRPSRWLSLNMVVWGIIMTLMGLVKTYGGLLACRLFLGVAEAGLFPGKYMQNKLKLMYTLLILFRC